MAYKGRFQIGDRVPLFCWTRNGSGTPTAPDVAPIAVVSSESSATPAHVLTMKLPIFDRYVATGVFRYELLLDARFADSAHGAGRYSVAYQWKIGGTAYGDTDIFEVVANGHSDGAGLSMTFFARPNSNFIVLQTDSGRVLRRRNPRL